MQKEELHLLVEECKHKSNTAFEKLYTAYAPKMKGVAYRYVADFAKSEDVLHDAFIKVYEKIPELRDSSVFEGWLRRIVVNQALDTLKSEKKFKEAIAESEQNFSNSEPEGFEDKDDSGYGNVSTKQLMDALESLPDGYKTIFNMYVIDGFRHKEIAEKLGVSEGTSKSQLAKAKTYLKKQLTTTSKLQFG